MAGFRDNAFQPAPTAGAPNRTIVRAPLQLADGSFAQFELAPGQVSAATYRTKGKVCHRLGGKGEM